MRNRTLLGIALAISLMLSSGLVCTASASEEVTVKRVLDAWNKRRHAIKTVMYKVEGTEVYAKGSMTEDDPRAHPGVRKQFPPKDLSFPKSFRYSINFTSGAIRKESRCSMLSVSKGVFLPEISTVYFDGKSAKVMMPRESNSSEAFPLSRAQPELKLYEGGKEWALSQDDYPILFAHGRPQLHGSMIDAVGYFDRAIKAEEIRVYGHAYVAERKCAIVRSVPLARRSNRVDEFLVDLDRDGAIVRWQALSGEVPFIRYNVNYSNVNGYWLPQSYQFDLFPMENGRRVIVRSENMKITEITVNPTLPNDFVTPSLKPGMVVSDPKGDLMTVASDSSSLVPYGHPTHTWSWWHWCVAIAVGMAVTVSISLLWRRCRARA